MRRVGLLLMGLGDGLQGSSFCAFRFLRGQACFSVLTLNMTAQPLSSYTDSLFRVCLAGCMNLGMGCMVFVFNIILSFSLLIFYKILFFLGGDPRTTFSPSPPFSFVS